MAEVMIDDEKRRLLVKCFNRDEGNCILSLPARRWMSKQSLFIVPQTRANALQMLSFGSIGKLGLSPEVKYRLEQIAESPVGNRPWPSWYSFKTRPFPEQWEALMKIYKNDYGALFMLMGTGKTKVVIDVATAHFYERRISAAVVICPLTVSSVWRAKEIPTHSPCDTQIITVDGSFDWRRVQTSQEKMTWLLVGIESLSQGKTAEKLMPFVKEHPCLVAVDESSRIKNSKAIRTQKVFEIGREAVIKLISTGTPAVNDMMDLYAQFEFLDTNIIGVGDFYAFRNRYAVMGGYKQKEIVGYDNVEELMGMIEPFTYRCDKPKGMPDKLYTIREVAPTPEQVDMYKRVKGGLIDNVSVENVLQRILRLQQVVSGFVMEDRKVVVDPETGKKTTTPGKIVWQLPVEKNPKIQAIVDLLETDLKGHKVIIWAKQLWEVDGIIEGLQKAGLGRKIIRFAGETTDAERDAWIEDFQTGDADTWVGTVQKGGIGLTLTAAHHIIYFNNTFSLEDRLQSEDRVHRRGQANHCLYVDIFMPKTVDKVALDAIAEKKDLDRYVKDKLDEAGGRLPPDLLGGP